MNTNRTKVLRVESAMPPQGLNDSDDGVVPFRPRIPTREAPADDVKPPVRDADEDEFRHRMITNGLSLLVIGLLVAGGVWLALTIADIRKNQDCVLSGRRNCAQVQAPAGDRW